MEEEPKKQEMLFGRDISAIPCFRSSFLYGISGGLGMGVLTFLGTSRTRLSTHVGYSSFCAVTMGYWFVCRYQWSKQRFEIEKLQEAMKKQAMYEGTEIERELKSA